MTQSWIIISRETGKPVFETFTRKIAARVNLEKYEVLTAKEWLVRFNKQVKANDVARA
jgi:hypothetical protein